MQSSNPVFARSAGFNGRSGTNMYGNRTYPGNGITYPAYGTPTGGGGGPTAPSAPSYVDQGPMTIDSVVQKTGITLALLVLAAAATWVLLPEGMYPLAMGAVLVGMGLGFVVSFKRVVNPGLVMAYAVIEGIFLGAVSRVFENAFPGIVGNAVIGTMLAFAGTLAAYKFFNISVTPKFRKFVVIASFSFVGLILVDFVLGLFGLSFGWNGYGAVGFIASVVGLALGVLMLVLDFDYVERGVAAGLPERESWRAAFGLTVTIVWLYIELLRILAILRGN
ncbi:MAG TPA: Bax inhibitor-1/YccA family protein [Nocardioidaceae bacterium]|nr:Bax inhibitor-1/YccA family protein [Nocardioidaceae bacterium]